MATIKAVLKGKRNDGFYPVYLRVTHNRKTLFIRTDKLVSENMVSATGAIEDPYVNKFCANTIVRYYDMLNKVDIELWGVDKVVSYITNSDKDLSFSKFANKHIAKMINAGQERNARNYQLALANLERYAGTTEVMFSQLTSKFCNSWISSLEQTHRAKEMYPVCLRQVFKAAVLEYNDYELGDIRIKSDPWSKVRIPKSDQPQKLAISPEACRAFFDAPLPETRMVLPIPEIGQDVAKMVLCLGGMNTVDIFGLRKEDYFDGVIHYKRAKTRRSRSDQAYMEMRVPEIIKPLFEKYAAKDDSPALFNFSARFSNSDSFGACVNKGLRLICESMGISKEDDYSVYTFRHTWGTIAQNYCGASFEDVAFGMNHSTGHRVTRGYIKIDYSRAWDLNEKVIDVVFGDGDKVAMVESQPQATSVFKLSSKYMVRATATLNNRLIGELKDIGFSNIDEVIFTLVDQFRSTIPRGCKVMFKIVNLDKDQVWTGERTKGKSF